MHRLLVAASLLLPAVAFAQDIPHRVPPNAVRDSWAGPYIGAYLAAGAGRAGELADGSYFSSQVTPPNETRTTEHARGDFTGRATGSMVDLFAGHNWRSGNFVVGGQIEASVAVDIDLNASGPRKLDHVETSNGVVTDATSQTITNGNDPRLRFRTGLVGRAGFLARPDLLLYGLAGLEFGHFSFPDNDDGFGGSNRKWAVGYTAGAGAEVRFDDHWSLRAEYRFLHFDVDHGDATGSSSVNAGTFYTNGYAASRQNHADMHLGKIGLVYRFGETGPMAATAQASRSAWSDSWAGPYLGVYFGAGAGHAAQVYAKSDNGRSSDGINTSTSSQPSSGAFAGDMTGSMNELFLGYNWRQGNLVVGAQLEGTLFSDVSSTVIGPLHRAASSTTNGVPNNFSSFSTDTGQNTQQLRSSVGLIGRAGFLATQDLLLYGLGGLELGHFVYYGGKDAVGGENGKWVAGYTAGVGGELRIGGQWSLRGEYRYMHFDVDRNEVIAGSSVNRLTGFTASTLTNTVRQTAADFHIGKIGVVYKFGTPGPASAMAAVGPAAVSSWNDGWAGPYMGAYFGAGAGRARESLAERSAVTPDTSDAAMAGGIAGAQADLFAGYSVRNDRFLLGGQIEATQFSAVAAKTTGIETNVGNGYVGTSTVENNYQLRSMVGVVGRAGFLATPNLLLYGLGGLALGHFTYPDNGARIGDKNGKWAVGYTAGVGGELKVSSHWSLRAEYRYLHFDDDRNVTRSSVSGQTNNGVTTISESSFTQSRHIGADFHLGKIGLAYRFGAGPVSATAAMPDDSAACCDRWTGAHAGVYAAGGAGRVRDAVTATQDFTLVSGNFFTSDMITRSGNLAGDVTGGTIDLFAGYNWRAGNIVIGGQAEGTLFGDVVLKSRGTTAGTTTSSSSFGPVTVSPGTDDQEQQQLLRSRFGLIGRAGFLVTPNLLLYGLGGLEFGHFAYPDAADFSGGANGKWAVGYTAGAGGELKLTDRWSLRGEYRYMRFNVARSYSDPSRSTDLVSSDFISLNAGTTRSEADFHVGKIGVAYGFCACD